MRAAFEVTYEGDSSSTQLAAEFDGSATGPTLIGEFTPDCTPILDGTNKNWGNPGLYVTRTIDAEDNSVHTRDGRAAEGYNNEFMNDELGCPIDQSDVSLTILSPFGNVEVVMSDPTAPCPPEIEDITDFFYLCENPNNGGWPSFKLHAYAIADEVHGVLESDLTTPCTLCD